MLIRSLPVDSPTRQKDRDQPQWTVLEELTALVLEEISVFTSDHRRKKPIALPRPGRAAANPPGTVGIVQMAKRMAAAGRVRVVREGDSAGAG